MQSNATTVEQYLAELPADRRQAIETVREMILKNLDSEYEEGMQYGMIGYFVPHRVYPAGYHCDPKQPVPFACLASQKNHMALYLMSIYGERSDEEWFREQWAKTGKKLDMGKSCIRFRKLDDLALDVIGAAIRRVPAKKYLKRYESTVKATSKGAAKKARTAPKSAKKATKSTKSAATSAKQRRTKK